MINKKAKQAQGLVESLEERVSQINLLKEELQNSIRRINNSVLTGEQKIHEVRIQALIEYANSIGEGKYRIGQEQESENDNLKLRIDNTWKPYEFKLLFEDIDFFYMSFSIIDKLEQLSDQYTLVRNNNRSAYRNATLNFYMDREQDLSVKRIYYASPGEIVFKGVQEVLDKVVLILAAIEKTPVFIESIIKRFYNLRTAIKLDRKEQDLKLLRVINEIEEEEITRMKLDIERKTLRANESYHREIHNNELERNRLESARRLIEEKELTLEQIKSFAEKIVELEKKELLKGDKMEKRFVDALESFNNLRSAEKIQLPPKE